MDVRVYIIIDDMAVNLHILEKMITMIDKDALIFKCKSGQEGIDTFEECLKNKHDLQAVICDLEMPRMDGKECIRGMCGAYNRALGVKIQEMNCKFSIFTANDSYERHVACSGCKNPCDVSVVHKPIDKTKAKRMMNFVD
jgi:CheY-like chemotaxis protein